MKRILLSVIVYVSTYLSCSAQIKNAIQVDVLSIARKTARASFEHFVSPHYSIGITGSYSQSIYWLDDNRLLSRIAVFPEARAYIRPGKSLGGWFGALQLRYQHLKYDSYYWGFDENNDPLLVPIHQNFESYGYAVSLGYSEAFKNQSHFGYEFYLGYQINSGLSKAKIDAPKIQKQYVDTEEFVGFLPQISLSLKYGW